MREVSLVTVPVVLALISFWLWMGWDLNHNDALSPGERQRWAFVFLVFNVFGAGLYYREEYRPRH